MLYKEYGNNEYGDRAIEGTSRRLPKNVMSLDTSAIKAFTSIFCTGRLGDHYRIYKHPETELA